MNDNYGLGKSKIQKIIRKRLEENADLLIGVDDPEVNELVNVLVDAFADAIETNNRQLASDIEEKLKKYTEKRTDPFNRGVFRRY